MSPRTVENTEYDLWWYRKNIYNFELNNMNLIYATDASYQLIDL